MGHVVFEQARADMFLQLCKILDARDWGEGFVPRDFHAVLRVGFLPAGCPVAEIRLKAVVQQDFLELLLCDRVFPAAAQYSSQ